MKSNSGRNTSDDVESTCEESFGDVVGEEKSSVNMQVSFRHLMNSMDEVGGYDHNVDLNKSECFGSNDPSIWSQGFVNKESTFRADSIKTLPSRNGLCVEGNKAISKSPVLISQNMDMHSHDAGSGLESYSDALSLGSVETFGRQNTQRIVGKHQKNKPREQEHQRRTQSPRRERPAMGPHPKTVRHFAPMQLSTATFCGEFELPPQNNARIMKTSCDDTDEVNPGSAVCETTNQPQLTTKAVELEIDFSGGDSDSMKSNGKHILKELPARQPQKAAPGRKYNDLTSQDTEPDMTTNEQQEAGMFESSSLRSCDREESMQRHSQNNQLTISASGNTTRPVELLPMESTRRRQFSTLPYAPQSRFNLATPDPDCINIEMMDKVKYALTSADPTTITDYGGKSLFNLEDTQQFDMSFFSQYYEESPATTERKESTIRQPLTIKTAEIPDLSSHETLQNTAIKDNEKLIGFKGNPKPPPSAKPYGKVSTPLKNKRLIRLNKNE